MNSYRRMAGPWLRPVVQTLPTTSSSQLSPFRFDNEYNLSSLAAAVSEKMLEQHKKCTSYIFSLAYFLFGKDRFNYLVYLVGEASFRYAIYRHTRCLNLENLSDRFLDSFGRVSSSDVYSD